MADELGLSDVVMGQPLPVPGTDLLLRWPTPEEYDDAAFMETMHRKKLLADPLLEDLKQQPCSENERVLYEGLIRAMEEGVKQSDDPEQRQLFIDRLAGLRRILENRTLADELASDRAILVRDRWLTQKLLCNADGSPYFSPSLAEAERLERWRVLAQKVKDSARPVLWRMIMAIENAPFVSAQPPD